jgi:hypothetical protein
LKALFGSFIILLSFLLIQTNAAQALPHSTPSSADVLAVARANHFYNLQEYDKAIEELNQIAQTSGMHPDLMKNIEEILTIDQAKTEEAKGRTAHLRERGRINVSVSNVGGSYAEEPFSDQQTKKVVHNTYMTFSDLANESRSPSNKTVSEYWRFETHQNNVLLNGSMQYLYQNGPSENTRVRHMNFRVKGSLGSIYAGDGSVDFSRYVLNGTDYRGVGAYFDGRWNKLEVMAGKTPFFKGSEGEDKYIYPRDIIGARNQFTPVPWWDTGQSFSVVRDKSSRTFKLSPFRSPTEIIVYGLDNDINIIPGKFKINHESAFSSTDDDLDVLSSKRTDMAHYLRAHLTLRRLQWLNIFEYVGPDFESGSGLSAQQTLTGGNSFLPQNGTSSDRLHYESSLTYRPVDWLYTNGKLSITKNAFGSQLFFPTTRDVFIRNNEPELTKERQYQLIARISPPSPRLPRFGLRWKHSETKSSPGSFDRTPENETDQYYFNVSKDLYGFDVDARLEYEIFSSGSGLFDDEEAIRASTTISRYFLDRYSILTGYAYHRRDRITPSGMSPELEKDHELHLAVSGELPWGGSGSASYDISLHDDTAVTEGDQNSHRFSFSLTRAYSRKLFGSHELSVYPFLSFYKDLNNSSGGDRDYLSAKLETSLQMSQSTRLTLSAEYRNLDVGHSAASDGSGEETRILMSVQSSFEKDAAAEEEKARLALEAESIWDRYFGSMAWQEGSDEFLY